jgi:thymidine phosphorylase
MLKYNVECIEKAKDSVETIDLSEFKKWSVSKCSVGKYNNKLSLVVIPIIASLGGKVAKISNRDNEYHQSIIEKLETIPGFSAGIPLDNFLSQLRDVGISVVGNSTKNTSKNKQVLNNDVVLLAYSLIGKELAKGVYHIIFDIQLGPNEPIKTKEDAQLFYDTVKLVGDSYNRKVTVFVSDCDFPLGDAVGNAFEMKEAIKVLNGSITNGDFYNACLSYSSVVASTLYNIPEETGFKLVSSALNKGIAYKTFEKWIEVQGGNLSEFDNILTGKKQVDIFAKVNGNISIDVNKLREVKRIMPDNAGIVFTKKHGDHVSSGDKICTIYADDNLTLEKIKSFIDKSLSFDFKKNVNKNYFEMIY